MRSRIQGSENRWDEPKADIRRGEPQVFHQRAQFREKFRWLLKNYICNLDMGWKTTAIIFSKKTKNIWSNYYNIAYKNAFTKII